MSRQGEGEAVAPSPGALSTQRRPPRCSMIWRLIGRPRPVPCGLPVRVSPPWRNFSKMTAGRPVDAGAVVAHVDAQRVRRARDSATAITPARRRRRTWPRWRGG